MIGTVTVGCIEDQPVRATVEFSELWLTLHDHDLAADLFQKVVAHAPALYQWDLNNVRDWIGQARVISFTPAGDSKIRVRFEDNRSLTVHRSPKAPADLDLSEWLADHLWLSDPREPD